MDGNLKSTNKAAFFILLRRSVDCVYIMSSSEQDNSIHTRRR